MDTPKIKRICVKCQKECTNSILQRDMYGHYNLYCNECLNIDNRSNQKFVNNICLYPLLCFDYTYSSIYNFYKH